jgi:S1-C subfamily serine protease
MKAQGVDGISFAIPIDSAIPIVNQLIKNRVVVRPYVGMRMVNFFPESPQSSSGTSIINKFWGQKPAYRKGKNNDILSTETPQVLIVNVEDKSPAYHAGLQRYARFTLFSFIFTYRHFSHSNKI